MPVAIVNTPLGFGGPSSLPKQNIEYLVCIRRGAPGDYDGSAADIHTYHRKPKAQGGVVGPGSAITSWSARAARSSVAARLNGRVLTSTGTTMPASAFAAQETVTWRTLPGSRNKAC